ncbi:MAG: DGQHR domain-containing protein [Armatimonadetes bacterium]|nr:DGQHR domain-containing protein [Armatimonadota bacterium]
MDWPFADTPLPPAVRSDIANRTNGIIEPTGPASISGDHWEHTMASPLPKTIPALKVLQWRNSWDAVETDATADRRPPPHQFYVMSVPAQLLRALSGVERRSVEERLKGGRDKGIQRTLDEDRSKEIASFVESGYPWSTLSAQKRNAPEYQDLKMPGWLPTAIVINVKLPEDARPSGKVQAQDLVSFRELDGVFAEMHLPGSMESLPWDPADSHPIEVIDGQHRLWAFDDLVLDDEFSLPVVAFLGLDLAWQAYLFYVINIKPKKINTSLAYDLYPLLREQDWLERGEIHIIYREARAQELTEALWSFPGSPWYQRINMLGEAGAAQVRQASWVRNLTATLVRRRSGPNVRIGGLFGTPDTAESQWNRTDQAAILISFWSSIQAQVKASDAPWASALREETTEAAFSDTDPAFTGRKTLLNTDQGVRGLLHIMNDVLMVSKERIGLSEWQTGLPNDRMTPEAIAHAIESLGKKSTVEEYLVLLATSLAGFDWRTSDAPGLEDDHVKTKKQTYRGSGGYKSLRQDLLDWLSQQDGIIGDDAEEATRRLSGEYSE